MENKTLDFAWDAYKGLFESFQKFALQNGAFTALVLGWIYTSKEVRLLIGGNVAIAIFAVLGCLIYTGFHGYWCFRHYQRSMLCRVVIEEQNEVSPSLLGSYQITKQQWISVASFHAVLCVYVCALVVFGKNVLEHAG